MVHVSRGECQCWLLLWVAVLFGVCACSGEGRDLCVCVLNRCEEKSTVSFRAARASDVNDVFLTN